MSNQWQTISKFVNFTTKGITPSYVEHSSIIVLNQKCIRNNKIDYSFSQYTDDTKNISSDKFIRKWDILVNSTGTGTAGRSAFVSEIPQNYKLIVDSHILILRCSSFHEAQCLSYTLYSFEKTLMSFMTGSSGQSELDKVVLLWLKTKLTEDTENQQKIASILSNLDTKIEFNNKINTELETMAKTLYDYWFVQFDFPGENGKPYKSSGGEMMWSEELKREVPKGWEVKNIWDLLNKYTNKSISIESKNILESWNHPVITQDNKDFISGFTNEENPIKDVPIIIFGDHSCTLRYVDFPFFRGADWTQIMSFDKNMTIYIYLFLQNTISQIPNYGKYERHYKYLKKFQIVIPESKFLINFQTTIKSIFEKISQSRHENQELAELRDFLLPMLMNGQVVVE